MTSTSPNGSEPAVDSPAPPPPRRTSPWPEVLRDVAASLCSWLSRPRVRLTLIGVILLFVGGLLVTNSVWTLPLVIVGALMVAVAWVGHRLDGRLAVEWGDTGTQLEFRAKMKAVETAPPELGSAAEPEDADVVEGEAHTVEIEVAELKALIAAAESAESEIARLDASAHAARILRVARGGGRSSEAGG